MPTFPIRQYWNDNEAAPANGGLVNTPLHYSAAILNIIIR